MTTRKFQVAVILVNYNSSSYTLACIDSIVRMTEGIRYQIVVVDNNSRPAELTQLNVISDPRVTVVHNAVNAGFSGANMVGVRHADAEVYYFLNNDTLLLNNCLRILYDFLVEHPQVSNCSGEMINGKGEYEYNFRYFPTLALKLLGSSFLRVFHPDRYPDKYRRYQEPMPVDLVNGSSMFIRASSFEEIGGFDTTYFLYCEEEDIALRLKRAGYLTYFIPAARYQHFENKSSASDNTIRLPFLKEFYISFLYYYGKNYGKAYRFAIQVLYFFKMLRKFYRDKGYVYLAFFIAAGAPARESLRFKQK